MRFLLTITILALLTIPTHAGPNMDNARVNYACLIANGKPAPGTNPDAVSPERLQQLMASATNAMSSISPRSMDEKEAMLRARNKPICDQALREAEIKDKALAEEQAQQAKTAAEHRQQQDEANKKYAEKQKRAEAAKAAEDALPYNVLLDAYAQYAYVKWCYDSREGYLLTYIKDAELAQAKMAIKAIEEKATKANPVIDTDEVWKRAVAHAKNEVNRLLPYNGGVSGFDRICRATFRELLKSSPVEVYSIEKP